MESASAHSVDWPGNRLGLPDTGPRSIARPGRRIGALIIDYGIAYGLGYWFFGGEGWIILALFAGFQIVFISTLGGSLGHLIFGLRLVPVRPAWVGVLKPAIRTLLLCLVIPAVIWDRDQRGLHDRLAATILVRR